MRHFLVILVGALLLAMAPHAARAQSIDDLELRKRSENTKISFGMLALLETATALNRDRPELSNLLFVAPQLKIGNRLRLRLNMGLLRAWLDRQDNPWDLTDWSIQLSHLGIYRDPWLGVLLSGYSRYALPTSKASRNAGSYGHFRLTGKASRSLGPVHLSLELSGRKYFYGNASWSTDEDVGSTSWFHSAGMDSYVANNASYGLDETATATLSVVTGLDLSLVWGMVQRRNVQPDEDHSDSWGSSYLQNPRQTGWEHAFRFVLDATLAMGALPWVKGSDRASLVLGKTYLSAGYAIFAPQLQNEGRTRSLNPFNPKYAQLYLDLMVLY